MKTVDTACGWDHRTLSIKKVDILFTDNLRTNIFIMPFTSNVVEISL